jgi:LysM repeat protein
VVLALAACDRFAPGVTPATLTAPAPGTQTATAILPSATPRPFTATSPATASATSAPQSTDTPAPESPTASLTAPPAATVDPCAARHTVRAGERLFRIGLQYGVDWQEIARANNIADPSLIYPGQVLCIPHSGGIPGPTSTPPPPPTANVTQPVTPAQGGAGGPPTILTFTAYPPEGSPGQTITLVWTTTGAASALLVEPICCQSNGGNLARDVPPNGSIKISLDGAVERDTLTYTLIASGAGGQTTPYQSVAVPLPCPDAYFFNAPAGTLPCPASAPVTTQAAEQLFEGGRMIWLEALNAILVLWDDGTPPNGPSLPPDNYASFPNTWTAGEPESDPALTPPDGLYQPVRGFGKVWRGDIVPGQAVRDSLGWALGPEQLYTAVFQRPWATCRSADASGAVANCSGPAPIMFLRNAEGRLIRTAEFGALARHTVAQWQFWTP